MGGALLKVFGVFSDYGIFMVRTRVPEDAYVDTMSSEEFRHCIENACCSG